MNTRQKQLSILLVVSGVLAGLNWYANAHHLYFQFWWFDIVMHFLGGVFSGLAVLWAYHYFCMRICDQRKARLFLVALMGTLIIGVAWEVFEGVAGIHLIEAHIVSDTLMDLLMDSLGALAAFFAFIPQKDIEEVRYTDDISH